jgi:DNA-binding CsgD family transcriptional regulator/tetratricopeptide (TPR) repeat protein
VVKSILTLATSDGIDRALDSLAAGNAGVVTITGELGAGKTRLAEDAGARALARGHRVVWGNAFARPDPFALLLDALDGVALEGATPGVLRDLLTGLAEPGALVLVLDDLQAADGASVQLLAAMLHDAIPNRVLTILSCRSGQWPSALVAALEAPAAQQVLTRVQVPELSAAELDDLLGDLDRVARRRVAHDSGGNPLYALTLARAPDGAELPSHLRAVINEHLGALPPPALKLVRAASVVGDPFDVDLAAHVARLSPSDTDRALAALTERVLLRTREDGRIGFRAPVLRRAVYEGLGLAPRLAAHRRTARLVGERDGPLDVQAHHVEYGGGTGAADVAVLLEAAESFSPSRPALAARWFAATLLRMPETDERQPDTLIHAATALLDAGRIAEGRDAFERFDSIRSHAALADPDRLSRAARVEYMLGLAGPTRAALRAALESDLDPAAAASLRAAVAMDYWRLGERNQMARNARVAAETAQLSSDQCLRATAFGLLALAEYWRGRAASARASLDEADRLVSALPDATPTGLIEALLLVGFVSHGLERFSAAADRFDRGIRLARTADHVFLLVPLTAGRAMVELATGHLMDAWRIAADARTVASTSGGQQGQMWAHTVATLVAVAQGNTEPAMQAAQRATAAADGVASGFLADAARCCLGVARIESGAAYAGSQQILRHGGGAGLERLGAGARPGWYATLAKGSRQLGDFASAGEWVERAEASAAELGLAGRTALAQSARARLVMEREPLLSARLATEAAEAFEGAGRICDAGRALTTAGQALARAGDRSGAVLALERAHVILSERGAQRSRDVAARQLRLLGQTISRPPGRGGASTGVGSLSGRERAVAELVAGGLTNQGIADELLVSPKTVEDHLARAFAKLGVSSRAGVAAAIESSR